MTDLAIETRDLTKSYGTTRALDGFTLQVEPGKVAGFLGPNGAGKTTTIRILLGMLRADGGTVRLLGKDPWTHAVELHRRLAYVAGDVTLWPELTGGEAIDLLTRLRRGPQRTRRRAELLERFELDPTKRTRAYSKGNRQKVALVAALASDAELFLLDEPTSGLDPLMAAVFTDEVRMLRDQGRTVLLSSHILGEVEALCDTVTIIRSGKDVETGTLAELRSLARSSVNATTGADLAHVGSLAGVHDFAQRDGRATFSIEGARLNPVLRALADAGVNDVTITPPSLEELFLQHYGQDGAHDPQDVRTSDAS